MFDRILNTPLKKTPFTPIYLFMDGVQLPQARATSGGVGAVYFLPISSQKFLVLILSTLEG